MKALISLAIGLHNRLIGDHLLQPSTKRHGVAIEGNQYDGISVTLDPSDSDVDVCMESLTILGEFAENTPVTVNIVPTTSVSAMAKLKSKVKSLKFKMITIPKQHIKSQFRKPVHHAHHKAHSLVSAGW